MSRRGMMPLEYVLNSPPSSTSAPEGSELDTPSPPSKLHDLPTPSPERQVLLRKKTANGSLDLSMTQPTGPIKYPPHEQLDTAAYRQVALFEVQPFGQIASYCAHIPYSSDKRDVFEKTGRESLRVFTYKFRDPNDGETYDVMWDYIGGFVRISPFFKCRKHKKTGPSKMLGMNPGLREVTFHMTGGNRIAQGYWLPFSCAKAVCATFCSPIAGALIPIFGPTFPDQCTPLDAPTFGRMIVDQKIIQEATHEVAVSKHANLALPRLRPEQNTSHPRPDAAGPMSQGPYTKLEDYSMGPRRPTVKDDKVEQYPHSTHSSPSWRTIVIPHQVSMERSQTPEASSWRLQRMNPRTTPAKGPHASTTPLRPIAPPDKLSMGFRQDGRIHDRGYVPIPEMRDSEVAKHGVRRRETVSPESSSTSTLDEPMLGAPTNSFTPGHKQAESYLNMRYTKDEIEAANALVQLSLGKW